MILFYCFYFLFFFHRNQVTSTQDKISFRNNSGQSNKNLLGREVHLISPCRNVLKIDFFNMQRVLKCQKDITRGKTSKKLIMLSLVQDLNVVYKDVQSLSLNNVDKQKYQIFANRRLCRVLNDQVITNYLMIHKYKGVEGILLRQP